MNKKYQSLAIRFKKDYDLPFPYVNWEHFIYCLNTFGYRSQWDKIIKLVHDRFSDNPGAFLDEYDRVKDVIMSGISQNQDYDYFRHCDMNRFNLDEESKNISKNNIYNQENIGKLFVSIDLKEANFQTLKHISSAIVNNKPTYEEYIKEYTNIDYIINSKHTRQVLFGQFCPNRHIIAERFFINEIRKVVGDVDDWKVISMSNDEIVYEVGDNNVNLSMLCEIHAKILETTGFETHVEAFKLRGFNFRNVIDGKDKFTFYSKRFIDYPSHLDKFTCVPEVYWKLINKLYYGLPIKDEDYLFSYEKSTCQLRDEFTINEITK